MNLKELSLELRPRERLQQQGLSVLSTAELLAIILKSGTPQENVLQLSQHLLSKYGLQQLSLATLEELQQEHGIGLAKACQILAVFELSRRIPQPQKEQQLITCAKDVAQIYLPQLQSLQQEQFMVLYLDTKHRLAGDEILTKGILNASLIHPREVFYGAIKHLAHSIIVLHNHPSGDPTPSAEDVDISKRLKKTGEILGISLVDHIIIGHTSWWSWQES